jgi:hypothetical protein
VWPFTPHNLDDSQVSPCLSPQLDTDAPAKAFSRIAQLTEKGHPEFVSYENLLGELLEGNLAKIEIEKLTETPYIRSIKELQ